MHLLLGMMILFGILRICCSIKRVRSTDTVLHPLCDAQCWPCLSKSGQQTFYAIGKFYVSDRQDLFDIFKDAKPFLDFDFEMSKTIAKLLRSRGCVSFLSTRVIVSTEAHEPLQLHKAPPGTIRNVRMHWTGTKIRLSSLKCQTATKLFPAY